jgi:hypothetical protein
MPLSLSELEELQADHLADDVAIDLDLMSLWTREEAEAFFESGGTAMPAARVDKSAPAAIPQKLGRKARIGLLHGTANNALVMRMQLGRLSVLLRPTCGVPPGLVASTSELSRSAR